MTNNTHEAAPTEFFPAFEDRCRECGSYGTCYTAYQKEVGRYWEPRCPNCVLALMVAPTLAEEHRLMEAALRGMTAKYDHEGGCAASWGEPECACFYGQARAILDKIDARKEAHGG